MERAAVPSPVPRVRRVGVGRRGTPPDAFDAASQAGTSLSGFLVGWGEEKFGEICWSLFFTVCIFDC